MATKILYDKNSAKYDGMATFLKQYKKVDYCSCKYETNMVTY